jgi:hypothetical protein
MGKMTRRRAEDGVGLVVAIGLAARIGPNTGRYEGREGWFL